MTQSLVLPWWVGALINLFADGDSDKTDSNEDDFGEDDLDDTSFGEDESKDADDKDDDDDDGDDDDDDDSKSKDKDKKKSKDDAGKKDTSAIVQKRKFRAALKKAEAEVERLRAIKEDKGSLTDAEKREKQAQEYLAKEIEKALAAREKATESKEAQELEEFEDELEEVLEDNDGITRKELLAVCEELDVMPAQALKVIQREAKLKTKAKPKLPDAKRGSSEIRDDKRKGDDKPKTLDDINREVKQKLKEGKL